MRFFVSIILILLISTSCGEAVNDISSNDNLQEGTTEYIDYTIGGIKFAPLLLRKTSFLNGDKIPEAKTAQEWRKAGENGTPAWCYSSKKNMHGEAEMLYNYYALSDTRGIIDIALLPTSALLNKMKPQLISESANKEKRISPRDITEERNHLGKFFDLEVINWWIAGQTEGKDSTVANIACWDMGYSEFKIQSASKKNGFIVRYLTK